MGEDDDKIEGGLFDVRDILGDRKKLMEFSIALWCATTGKTPADAAKMEEAEAERIAKYGPPLKAPDSPWPSRAICDDCGKYAEAFGTSLAYKTDIPQHRWVRVYRCMACDDEHQRQKWKSNARGMRASREADGRN